MWKLKIFGLLLLGSCGVLLVSAESVAPEETTIKSDADAVTLSTELRPPPLPAVGEHRGIVYLVNLFAVKNKTDKSTAEKAENTLESASPEVVGPLASLLFVVDEGDKAGPFDDITKLVVNSDYEAREDTDSEKGLEEVKVDPTFSEASEAVPDKLRKLKKSRSKRTLKKCAVCGGSGGYGGGGWSGGDSYNPHQSGGGGQIGYAVPFVVVLDGNGGGGHNRRQYHNGGGYGDGGGHYGQNYGGGQYPSGGGYDNHPGGYGYGGGGGGSNAQASAYAQASASAYGK